MMDACRRCSACRRNCPTGAIGPDRFLVRAERCLTFHNERPAPFPGWLDPAWHHRLFGCMRCQTVCPANRGVPLRTEEGPSLSPRESEILLGGVPFVRIPAGLKTKFKRFGWTARDYQMLPRNLQAVFGNPRAEGADRGAP